MSHAARYRSSSQVERKGFEDGNQGKPRLFPAGFDRRYNAGQAVAAWSRRSLIVPQATAA